ncbi:MAG: sugar phosphate isomerase/epimerase family protein [Verrucomicrobiota bacterium]
MMKIGNQTSFAARVLEPFEFAAQQGFTAFEFFPDRGFSGKGGWHEQDLDAATRQMIRDTARAKNLELTVHAPLEYNPMRTEHSERLGSSVQFARDIGATLLNLHLDVGQGPEAFALALAPALRQTAEAGLKLAVENTVWTGPEDFNRFFAAVRRLTDAPFAHCGMCFDLGHANLYGATQNNYWKYLDALAPTVPLIHLHLHENYGDRDSHLPLFTGPAGQNPSGIIGLLKRLRVRKFSGCAILEQWPQPPALLVTSRDQLERLLQLKRSQP